MILALEDRVQLALEESNSDNFTTTNSLSLASLLVPFPLGGRRSRLPFHMQQK